MGGCRFLEIMFILGRIVLWDNVNFNGFKRFVSMWKSSEDNC